MNVSIVWRVIYDPRRTFEEFIRSPHVEALIPPLVLAVTATVQGGLEASQRGSPSSIGLLVGSLYAFVFVAVAFLIAPLINTLYMLTLQRWISNTRPPFASLFTAFVLCELPTYLQRLLSGISNIFNFGPGNVVRPLIGTHPFVYEMIATITPFFLWTIILWWVAVTVLLRAGTYQRIFAVGSLALLDMIFEALLGSVGRH